MLEKITPVILTFNEENNIERSLSRLGWAKDIIVVDSFSTDNTLSILSRFSNVRVYQRIFDNHANQWNYAIYETRVNTEWILALDADYYLDDDITDEISKLNPANNVSGYRASFRYCIHGKPLRASLYPPVIVLYKNNMGSYYQDGHCMRLNINGDIQDLINKIDHDDRKPFKRWLSSQRKYMKLEADLIYKSSWTKLSVPDKVRKTVLFAPFLTFFYCLFYKKLIFDGISGIYYSMLRTIAEFILSRELLLLYIKSPNVKQ